MFLKDKGEVFGRYCLFNRTSADVHMHNTCCAFVYQLMCGYFLKFHPRCSFHGIEDVFSFKAMSFLLNV